MQTITKVDSLYIGTPKVEKNIRVETAINKSNISKIEVQADQIIGDAVANLKHHGGDNRVLHQYAAENYEFWKRIYPDILFEPGCLGENLSASGMNEGNVCIGDLYQIGEVECIVTEPRKPCGTINMKMGVKGLAKKIQSECLTGWFYKISKSGTIKIGDSIKLLDRPFPELSLESCIKALLLNKDKEILVKMIENPVLSENWKAPAKKLFERNQLEDDSARLGE